MILNCILPIWAGRTPHGVCELKFVTANTISSSLRRTPHGVCELKWRYVLSQNSFVSRTPHGVCELKFYDTVSGHKNPGGRTPHGVCELKLLKVNCQVS